MAGSNDSALPQALDLFGRDAQQFAHHLVSGIAQRWPQVGNAPRRFGQGCSKGGKAFIVLPSTAKNDSISRIVPVLSPGTHVSTGKNDVDYVVTEFGMAQLRGKSAKQRARELIGIAHPNFREELTGQARRMGMA